MAEEKTISLVVADVVHHSRRVQLKVAVITPLFGLLLTSNPASRDWP
jgi:hypothetical protein